MIRVFADSYAADFSTTDSGSEFRAVCGAEAAHLGVLTLFRGIFYILLTF